MRDRLLSGLLTPKSMIVIGLNVAGFIAAMGIYFEYVQRASPRYGIPIATAVMIVGFGGAAVLKRVLR